MRRFLSTLAALAVLAGCGGDDEPATPTACFAGEEAYLAALEDAPNDVLIEDTTPIADCIAKNQSAGDLGQVGPTLVAVANELNARAQDDPAGPATVQLGYLIGTVQEAAATTGGIHQDLVLRLDSAARHVRGGGSFGADFERAFGRGYAAAQ